jgi:carnitine-CoA ligase
VAQAPAPLPDTDAGFVGLFNAQARATPERVFAHLGGWPLSLGALAAASARLAAWLDALGVAPGGRVALMLRNGEAALGLMLALAGAGRVWVPINTQAVGDSLAYVLRHAEPQLVIAEADLAPAIKACGVELGHRLIEIEAACRAAANLNAKRPLPPAPPADAPFAIMYTPPVPRVGPRA